MTALNLLTSLLVALVLLNIGGLFLTIILLLKTRGAVDFWRRAMHFEDELKKSVREHVEELARVELSRLISAYKQVFESQLAAQFKKLENLITAQKVQIENFARKQEGLISKQEDFIIERAVEFAQKEIEEYKEFQLKRVDSEVTRLIDEVSREVLNHSILTEEHEKLVWDALEKARADGIFRQTTVAKVKPKEITT